MVDIKMCAWNTCTYNATFGSKYCPIHKYKAAEVVRRRYMSDVEKLLESSKIYEDESGNYRYTSKSDKKKGTVATRPEGSAPLFDSDTGRSAALKRWENTRTRAEVALWEWAKEQSENPDMTFDEAFNFVVSYPLFEEARKGKTPAGKLILTMLDVLPRKVESGPKTDNRSINFITLKVTGRDGLEDYIERLENSGQFKAAEFAKLQLTEIDSGFEGIVDVTVPTDTGSVGDKQTIT